MSSEFHKSISFLGLQPLRIPAGWKVEWNTLYATSSVERGEFGGSSVFLAMNEGRRFCITVEFRPEFDPNGHFSLLVEYQPWPRTENGRRKVDNPFKFDSSAEIVHSSETKSYSELVEHLEEWIGRCSIWAKELN